MEILFPPHGQFWDQLVLGIDYTRLDFFGCLRLPARVEKHQRLASKTYPTRIFGSPLLGEPNPTPKATEKKKHVELPLVRHGACCDELWKCASTSSSPKTNLDIFPERKKLVTAAVNRIYPPQQVTRVFFSPTSYFLLHFTLWF